MTSASALTQSPATATLEQARAAYSPYRCDYVAEVAVDYSGATTVTTAPGPEHEAARCQGLPVA
ncbi:hypothetical protein KYC5002_39305 [Archangium violaceum]|uniref:hypothetical protein n=1 Tax=Archangium violaceum TaxID=83451 RepID=UPI002B2BD065|nr:hypothetical protein KYC5002_39305 [Archangium gephyra]